MTTDTKPLVVERIEDLENRYTDIGLNTKTFPVSDAVNSARSDIAASSKAVKTAYDAGTRYATTKQQGQVILSHDVNSGEKNKALTPFGAKEALGDFQDDLDSRFDQIIKYIDQKFVEINSKFVQINAKIESRLPLFDSYQIFHLSRDPAVTPSTGRLWMYCIVNRLTLVTSGGDQPTTTASAVSSIGFASGGSTVATAAFLGDPTIVHMWRVFA